MIVLPFACLHGLGTGAFINGRFDDTPEIRATTRIIGRREDTGKNPEHYFRIDPAVAGLRKVRVPRAMVRSLPVGHELVIRIRSGRFGGAWYRVERRQAG